MKIRTWDEFRTERASAPIAAVIGVFDGLHIGHRELVGRALGKPGLRSTGDHLRKESQAAALA